MGYKQNKTSSFYNKQTNKVSDNMGYKCRKFFFLCLWTLFIATVVFALMWTLPDLFLLEDGEGKELGLNEKDMRILGGFVTVTTTVGLFGGILGGVCSNMNNDGDFQLCNNKHQGAMYLIFVGILCILL